MSSEIIYHQTMARLPAQKGINEQDLFFHLVQMGSSNCYEFGTSRSGVGRRSRSWSLISMGSRAQVLSTAIMISGGCEGGMLKLGSASKCASPEQHIRKTRRLLAGAEGHDLRDGIAYKGDPIQINLLTRDTTANTDRFYAMCHPGEFREFLAAHAESLAQRTVIAWSMAKVSGPDLR
jgi:hypothetical protein